MVNGNTSASFQYRVASNAAISCINEKSLFPLKHFWVLAISFVIGKKKFPFESFAICFMRILSFFGNENTRADCGGKVDLIADIAYKTLMVSNIYFIDLCWCFQRVIEGSFLSKKKENNNKSSKQILELLVFQLESSKNT